jgi:hypothetical protein
MDAVWAWREPDAAGPGRVECGGDPAERYVWAVSDDVYSAAPIEQALAALAEIYNAEDRNHAEQAAKAFAAGLRRAVAQSGREDHRRPRRAARFLRLAR